MIREVFFSGLVLFFIFFLLGLKFYLDKKTRQSKTSVILVASLMLFYFLVIIMVVTYKIPYLKWIYQGFNNFFTFNQNILFFLITLGLVVFQIMVIHLYFRSKKLEEKINNIDQELALTKNSVEYQKRKDEIRDHYRFE